MATSRHAKYSLDASEEILEHLEEDHSITTLEAETARIRLKTLAVLVEIADHLDQIVRNSDYVLTIAREQGKQR